MGIDVDPPRKGMHHRECIDRDIGCGCHEEDVMLWRSLGGRLGVDLARRFATPVGGGIFGKIGSVKQE